MVTLQVEGNVDGVRIVEQNNSNVFVDPGGPVDALAKVACLAGSTKSDTWLLLIVKAKEPRLTSNNQHALRLDRSVAAPLGPTFGWTTRIRVHVKLIQDYSDATATQLFGENTNALALCFVVELSIAKECCGHRQ
jgi:hypothetical protein